MKKSFQMMALLVVAMLGACSGGSDKTATEQVDEKPRVKLAKVLSRPVEQIQEYTATVEAEVKNNIAPSSQVRIDRIFVEVGDRVSKGQKLVSMDAANLKQIKYQLDNQQIEFKRIDELYKVGGASKSEWDAAKMNLDIRETSYKNLLENTSLLSPINGVVTARNYDNGDMYSGGGEPVLVVEQITPVKLYINVSEGYFTKVKKGASVSVKVDVYGDEEFEGKISLVYPTIDPTTRTFPVEIQLVNRDQRVRPGMFARATLNFGTQDHVVVPDLAIVKRAGSGDRYVYVYKDGKVSYNKVELGRRMDTEYELISGVENNSQVVVAGQTRLADGVEVEVEK
ncbi:efflux RND transporter periplasmic adaptor subunit [uncultured Bacteroides sp.]|uniref:efflux RND transporter periplasmic adaptor subunit n=1 Tax=uncultured Bacteroides sp. TaxID=162156 RepID=UPI00280B8834|nr:efflux RND transporter periplasmic adaptor subunit [uncultured Bacteroides sp.]